MILIDHSTCCCCMKFLIVTAIWALGSLTSSVADREFTPYDQANASSYSESYSPVPFFPTDIMSNQQTDQRVIVERKQDTYSTTQARVCTVCPSPLRSYDSSRHKPIYNVGVLANRGIDTAFADHNTTFSDYLTATAGRRFDPPIQFKMVPLNFFDMFEAASSRLVDYIYVNPSAYSCIESEYRAQSLVSQISRRNVRGEIYDLTMFAGVIVTRFDNDAINAIQDLRGKVVAAGAISAFGAGQMQFREMQNNGMSYINDPRQLVFTFNQGKIVSGVLSGEFDAGFIRTDQIENSRDEDGNPVDASLFKIIQPKPDLEIDGVPFPFKASTQLYPEWNVAALSHVPPDISDEVQNALKALREHGEVGSLLEECLKSYNYAFCDTLQFPENFSKQYRCDTSKEVSLLARKAMNNGKYAGFRTTLSYGDVRSTQQDTSFISKDEESNNWRCVRSSELYDAIRCPIGHFKKNRASVEKGCEEEGLQCREEYQCVCNPCGRAFDVEVFAYASDDRVHPLNMQSSNTGGCAKMSMCGIIEQTHSLTFRAIDNKRRESLQMTVTLLEGDVMREIPVRRVVQSVDDNSSNFDIFLYEFTITSTRVGTGILEIYAGAEQIPESPLRVQIIERDCTRDYIDGYREPDDDGNCICEGGTATIGDSCVPHRIITVSVFIPIAALIAAMVCLYVDKKKKQADSLWMVQADELKFYDPPKILGQGTFGLVVLAEYRGTEVAVKRVIPPRNHTDKKKKVISIVSSIFDLKRLKVELGNGDGEEKNGSEDIERAETASFGMQSRYRKPGTQYSGGIGDFATDSMMGGSNSIFTFQTNGINYWRLRTNFISEMRMLSKLRHPCITTVMGAVVSRWSEPMLLMEYMSHGSLYDILHNETMSLEGEVLLPILLDIAQGVRFLHSANPQIIHSDLKSQNVLVDSKFHAKVADFGMSQKKKVGAMGTPYWMAPEVLSGESPNTAASDIYSFGIILYELYSRKDPYEGEDYRDVLRLVCDPNVNKRPPVPQSCPPMIAGLMKDCIDFNPARRPSAADIDKCLKELDVKSVEPGKRTHSHQLSKELDYGRADREVLYKVFPKHIADALQVGRKVEPESHDQVTIFFSDIVGFTRIAATFSPIKVSDLLDRLYLAFDHLAGKHDIFKVETIGDAWMGVTNLVKDQKDDHVKRIAEFALDALEVSSETLLDIEDPSRGYVDIRAGFHSGPVVSRVVGSLNPRYGIFGDTVNTASRMESTSLKRRIQCSEPTAEILMRQAPDLPVRMRGVMNVKGKGSMKTYWVDNSAVSERIAERFDNEYLSVASL